MPWDYCLRQNHIGNQKFSVLLLATVLTLVGCQSNTLPDKPNTPEEQAEEVLSVWRIVFEVSGGIAGTQQQLLLNSRGLLQATDRSSGQQVERRLDAGALKEIEAILNQLPPAPPTSSPSGLPGRCADCLHYRVDINTNEEHQSFTLQSGIKADPPYSELQKRLSALLQQSLNGE